MLLSNCAWDAFSMVKIHKLFHDSGRRDKLPGNFLVDKDYYWTLIYEAFHCVTDYVNNRQNEDDFWQMLYYQDPAMTEYYRLCGEYDRLHGTGADTNPYRIKAERFVFSALSEVRDSTHYTLQTKLNHKWSCRLLIEYDGEYFSEYVSLLEALLSIFDFYKREAGELRAELTQNGVKAANEKEAA